MHALLSPQVEFFLRRLLNLTGGVTRLHHYVTLNSDARADLYTWQICLQSFKGKSVFLEQKSLSSQTIKLCTDASSELGFAVVFWKNWVAGSGHKHFTSDDITLLELYPLVLAAELFGKCLAKHCILFMTDNFGVVDIISKTTSIHRPIMKLVIQLVQACLKYKHPLPSRHIPGYQNVIADHLSRLQIDKARQMAPWLDVAPARIPDYLRPKVLLI